MGRIHRLRRHDRSRNLLHRTLANRSVGLARADPRGVSRARLIPRNSAMNLDSKLTAADLAKPAARVLELAGEKARLIEKSWDVARGAPVFTVEGKYTA